MQVTYCFHVRGFATQYRYLHKAKLQRANKQTNKQMSKLIVELSNKCRHAAQRQGVSELLQTI